MGLRTTSAAPVSQCRRGARIETYLYVRVKYLSDWSLNALGRDEVAHRNAGQRR
jgi:hypothetical protein